MRTELIVAACLLALGTVVLAEEPTLPELARQRIAQGTPAKPIVLERSRELVPISFEAMVSKADLIVDGVVNQSKVYLSDDQRALYTDYVVIPRQTLFQRSIVASRTPGATVPIVVQRWGGHTVIDGVQVSVEDSDLRPFRDGTELLLILNTSKDGKYHIVGDVAGVLNVQSGQVVGSEARGAIREGNQLVGLTIAQLQAQVARIRAGR
jgi:hypothetical protein